MMDRDVFHSEKSTPTNAGSLKGSLSLMSLWSFHNHLDIRFYFYVCTNAEVKLATLYNSECLEPKMTTFHKLTGNE